MAASFTQTFDTPSDTWVVNHNLGRFVTSDVFVDDGAGRKVKVFPQSVVHVSETVLRITFSSPKVGYVKVQ